MFDNGFYQSYVVRPRFYSWRNFSLQPGMFRWGLTGQFTVVCHVAGSNFSLFHFPQTPWTWTEQSFLYGTREAASDLSAIEQWIPRLCFLQLWKVNQIPPSSYVSRLNFIPRKALLIKHRIALEVQVIVLLGKVFRFFVLWGFYSRANHFDHTPHFKKEPRFTQRDVTYDRWNAENIQWSVLHQLKHSNRPYGWTG